MLDTRGLTIRFGRHVAVNHVTCSSAPGTLPAIVGPNGSGKTTLLTLLGALDQPTSGSIVIDDKDVTTLHDHALIKYRCEKIGFVFQGYNLVPNLTAAENCMLPIECAVTPKKKRAARAETGL